MRQDFLEQLRVHGRSLAMELKHAGMRREVLVTHYYQVPRKGPLNRLMGRTKLGYTTALCWEMGPNVTGGIRSLALGEDGVIYVGDGPLAPSREAVPLSEQHITTLEAAQAVRQRFYELEKRADIFNKLNERAE